MYCGEKVSVGSILDDRYEIRKILRKNGDIVVYEGWHRQIEEKFLIEELPGNFPDTEKILARARRLSDFSELSNLFQICDQFPVGENFYLIMEYPKGQCLEEIFASGKKLSEKTLEEMFTALIKSLKKLEESGIRDLAAEAGTLYLQEDGSLSLFPEPDRFMPEYRNYTYEICELFYQGLSGQKPVDQAVRLLFDEMPVLAEMNLPSDVEFRKIIDEGLKINREESTVTSLEELEEKLTQWHGNETQKKTKKRYWVAGGIAMAVLVCALLSLVYVKFEEKIRFWGIKTETVLLEPGEETNRKEYQKALDVIKKRAGKLTKKYLVKDDSGTIRVVLPQKTYKKFEDETLMNTYLSRPMKLTVAVGNVSLMYYKMSQDQYLFLDEEDILKIEETDMKEMQSLGTGKVLDKMLRITVSDEAAEEMKEKLGSLQEKVNKEAEEELDKFSVCACLDGNKNDYSLNIEAITVKDDWHVLEIPENAYFREAKDTWQEETFEGSFTLTSEISNIHWEKKTNTLLKKWVDPSEIPDPSVILEYNRDDVLNADAEADKGDYYHNIGDLAQRLEDLGVSYALGTVEGDYDRLAVKVRQKDMSDMVADILGRQDRLSIQDVWRNSCYASDIHLTTVKEDQDKISWKATIQCKEENMKNLVDSAKKSNGYVYLCSALGYTVGKTKLTEMPEEQETEDGSITSDSKQYQLFFTETDLGETGYFTKGMNALLRLFSDMTDQYNLNNDFKLVKVQYNEKGKMVSEKQDSRTAWEQNDKRLKKIRKTGQQADEYAEFREETASYCQGKKDLYVILHMDPQEDYSDTATERIMKIWQECQLENSDYSFVRFCVSEYEEYPIVYLYRSSAEEKWILSVTWADENYGGKFKERLYKELENKTFLKNGITEETEAKNLNESMKQD